ncbi:MAG: hypothetical protein Q9227_000252 [Pyrenula ochraceoflavens]
MASSLALQLSAIAKSSTNQLDLKAQKAAHSQSLLFEKRVAGSQDFDTLFQICSEGFEELRQLNPRYGAFSRSLFSLESKTQERTQMTAKQNMELDATIEAFLAAVGDKLLLRPAIKAVEWLIRRFRIHDATNDDRFFAQFNTHTLKICKEESQHQMSLEFWSSIFAEATASRLKLAKSGRREVQRQRQEDLLVKLLPVLDEGLSISGITELTIACYTVAILIAQDTFLTDESIRGLMAAVVESFNLETASAGLICLALLADQLEDCQLPRRAISAIPIIPKIQQVLLDISAQHDVTSLLLGLIRGCLSDLNFADHETRLGFVNQIFQTELLRQQHLVKAIRIVLEAANDYADKGENSSIMPKFSALVQSLQHNPTFSMSMSDALSETNLNLARLEAQLQMTFKATYDPKKIQASGTANDEREVEDYATTGDGFLHSLGDVPDSIPEPTFLVQQDFAESPLSNLFREASQGPVSLENFKALPLLRREVALNEPLYLSFFIRIMCQEKYGRARAAASKIVAETLQAAQLPFAAQDLIPYLLLALQDQVPSVREAACKAMAHLSQARYQEPAETEWKIGDLHSGTEGYEDSTLSTSDLLQILSKAFVPLLEECALDPTQISRILVSALKGESASSSDVKRTESINLKKSLRVTFFAWINHQIQAVPLYAVKAKLLLMSSPVDKVGSYYRSTAFLPLLQKWASHTTSEARDIASQENTQLAELEQNFTTVVTARDKHINETVTAILEDSPKIRPSFLESLKTRIVGFWPSLKHGIRVELCESLFKNALSLATVHEDASQTAKDLLRRVSIPVEVFATFLEKLSVLPADNNEQTRASKRRRISTSTPATVGEPDIEQLMLCVHKSTILVELLDESALEGRSELLAGLFKMLGTLIHLKARLSSELAYVLNITLGILLAIVKSIQSFPSLKLHSSIIRVDYIVDCVRNTENQQVQNTALLLIANLARLTPDTVLHSIMPIFTFRDFKLLRRDDEYSAHVIDQTIDQVIPRLIQSLRDQKKDVLAGGSDLLSSFTAAFEHIPFHRRARLFEALVRRLGPSEFLFAALALLAIRETGDGRFEFLADLAADFPVSIQLANYVKVIALIEDALSPDPVSVQSVLNLGQSGPEENRMAAQKMLVATTFLFQSHKLRNALNKAFRKDSQNAHETRTAFSKVLDQLLRLHPRVMSTDDLRHLTQNAIDALLGLPSLSELFQISAKLITETDDEALRQKTIQLVNNRLGRETVLSTSTQIIAIDFLRSLNVILEGSPLPVVQNATLSCIDQITEKCGRRDKEAVMASARVVVGLASPRQGDKQTSVLSLLCLASMVETCRESFIPLLSPSLSSCFDLMKKSLEEDAVSSELHDAGCSFMESVISGLSFMLTEEQLDSILCICSESASSHLPLSSSTARQRLLQGLAEKLDVGSTIALVLRDYLTVLSNGVTSVTEMLDLVGKAIELHPKSAIVKASDSTVELWIQILDLRRKHLSSPTEDTYTQLEIEAIEKCLHSTFIKMVYKLNDSTFRPIYSRLVDWASQSPSGTDTNDHRLISLFELSAHLFSTLKSLLTSYAPYIVEPATSALTSISSIYGAADQPTKPQQPPSLVSSTLFHSALSTLHPLLTHDLDSHTTSPTLFPALSTSLTSSLRLSPLPPFSPSIPSLLIPTLISLARAVSSHPSHHQTLNTSLCALRSDPRWQVRLASVQAQRSLTDELGEEWIENAGSEVLVFVNEMLEDEDERVEAEVRGWVRRVEELTGEEFGG